MGDGRSLTEGGCDFEGCEGLAMETIEERVGVMVLCYRDFIGGEDATRGGDRADIKLGGRGE